MQSLTPNFGPNRKNFERTHFWKKTWSVSSWNLAERKGFAWSTRTGIAFMNTCLDTPMNFRYARGLRYPNNISGWTCLFFLRLGSGQSIHCRPTEASPERVALINGNCRYCRIPKWRYRTIFLAIFWGYLPWTIAHCSAWNSNGHPDETVPPAKGSTQCSDSSLWQLRELLIVVSYAQMPTGGVDISTLGTRMSR